MADGIQIPLIPEPDEGGLGKTHPLKPPTMFPPVETPPVVPEPVPVPAAEPEPRPVGKTGGLGDLGWIGMLLVILGLIALAAAIVEFLNWIFAKMLGPLARGKAVPKLDTATVLQPLSNALGKAYTGIDQEIGVTFLTLAQMTSRLGQVILAGEQTAYVAATKLAALSGNLTGAQQKAGTALGSAGLAQKAASSAQAQAKQERVRATLHETSLETRLHNLEHNVTHLIEPELEGLRDKIPKLERGATVAWDEITKHEGLLGAGAVTAATAVALARLGGDWIRCETTQLLGRGICKSDHSNWRKLIKGSLDVLGIVEMCAALRLIVKVANSAVITDGLGFFSQGLGDLLKCTGATRPTPLVLPAPSLAPPSAWASIAPDNG